MTGSDSAPPRNYHHGDLRLALVEEAETWMRRQGGWGFTLRELARTLGVSHNAPYKHFEDKKALLTALGERGFTRLAERLEREMSASDQDDIPTLIEAAAVAYVGFALEEPAAFRLMFGEELAGCDEPTFRGAADGAFSRLSEAVARGVRTGCLRPDPNGGHAVSAWALVHGLSLLLIDRRLRPLDPGPAPDALVRAVARTLIEGLISGR
jgi:AcrR family transcriptional regulator